MMMIQGIHKGSTVTTVHVAGTGGISDTEVKDFAMDAANETPNTLFDRSIERFDNGNVSVVKLYTD